jgi:hypothetical protein
MLQRLHFRWVIERPVREVLRQLRPLAHRDLGGRDSCGAQVTVISSGRTVVGCAARELAVGGIRRAFIRANSSELITVARETIGWIKLVASR